LFFIKINVFKKLTMPTKAKKPTAKKLDSITGHDARNGIVTLTPATVDKVAGYIVTNDRTGHNSFHATREAAITQYNRQINKTQK
jgi:hypothetical protein